MSTVGPVAVEATRYAVSGWGAGELWMRGSVVLANDFDFGAEPMPTVAQTGDGAPCSSPLQAELAGRFQAFLGGEPIAFDDVELDLRWATPFQSAVAAALRGVPRGEVVTYGELAALAGYPGAARPSGSFCAANRFAFLVPCHRVVGAGGIGGYGDAGVEVKRRLLALEGVVLR